MKNNGPDLAGGIGVEAGTCSLGKSAARVSNSVCIGPFEDAGAALMRGNYAKASRLLRPLAEPGNTDAQVRLTLIAGAAYKKGDYATAVGLVRPLAEQGNVHAQARLAFLCANGEGVPQDYAAAVDWYRKAAERGSAIAQYNLADMYRVGEGVLADNAVAASWYRLQSGRARVRPSSKQSWDHVR